MATESAYQAILAFAALGGLIVSTYVAVLHHRETKAMRVLAPAFRRIARSLETEMKELRSDVDRLRGASPQANLDARKLAFKEREAEWKRTKDVMRAIGWLMGGE